MVKKAVITILLVEESRERSNEELRKEIFDALSRAPAKIPWMKNVKQVEILES
ncbi:hypothetical protein GWO13_10705 [Candidatus Bathyarchaeota archaeon]|nr:hypothetical protein [Candidatus Bathyarchaeota archaeon]